MQYEPVSGDLLNKAFETWLGAHQPDDYYALIMRGFKSLIHNSDFLAAVHMLTPEAAAMIKGMTGSHGHAYCRALMIKQKEPSVEVS